MRQFVAPCGEEIVICRTERRSGVEYGKKCRCPTPKRRFGTASDPPMHRLGFIPLSLLCLTTLASGAWAQNVEEAIARANRLQRSGDYGAALAAYREAADLAPERLDIHSNLAMAHLRLGQPQQAVPILRRVRQAAPEHVGAAFTLGLALFQAGQHPEAESELAWVLERQPANGHALHLYGLCLLQQGDLEGGIRALEDVVAAAAATREAYYTLASAYIRAGRVEKAAALVEDRMNSDESAEALLIRGSVRLAQKAYGPALSLFERARAGSAELQTLHSQMGVALLYTGDHGRAAREFEAELAKNPTDFNANAFLGWLYQQRGDTAKALDLLRNALGSNEFDTGVRYLLAQVHVSLREWTVAEGLLERVIDAQPEFVPAHVMLARVYAKLKRVDSFRREQSIIKDLNARQQQRDLQGVDHLYDGTVLSLPQR